MLSGDNSILQRATDAKTKSDEAQIRERIQLAYLSGLSGGKGSIDKGSFLLELQKEFGAEKATEDNIVESEDGKKWTVTIDGVVVELVVGSTTTPTPQVATLPSSKGTKPFLPSTAFSQVDGTDLSNGLVITDHKTEGVSDGNEYVWIEVPNKNLAGEGTISFTGPDYANTLPAEITGNLTDDQRTEIKRKLIAYVETLLNGSDCRTSRMGWRDEWYDSNNHIYDGTKWYKSDESADTKYVEDISYSGNSEDTNGCGLNYINYNTLYDNMLKSVYNHGGFWIGRYEAGIEGSSTNISFARQQASDRISSSSPKAVSKIDHIPYNWVYCSEAQTLASHVDNIDSAYNSSLMFGVQWDCVLKYLQGTGAVDESYITGNSSSWGNYKDSDNLFTVSRGKYAFWFPWGSSDLSSWKNIENDYTKQAMAYPDVGYTVFSTGVTTRNMRKNIYDIAGNMYEWTLEHSTSYTDGDDLSCVKRGGGFVDASGSNIPASEREENTISSAEKTIGFRVSIY